MILVYPVQSVRFVSPDRNGWEAVFVSLCPSDIWVGWGGGGWFRATLDGSLWGFVRALLVSWEEPPLRVLFGLALFKCTE